MNNCCEGPYPHTYSPGYNSGNKLNDTSVKSILKDTDLILEEMKTILEQIECSIFGPQVDTKLPEDPHPDDSLIMTLKRQKDEEQYILNIANRIKRGLWSDV